FGVAWPSASYKLCASAKLVVARPARASARSSTQRMELSSSNIHISLTAAFLVAWRFMFFRERGVYAGFDIRQIHAKFGMSGLRTHFNFTGVLMHEVLRNRQP